MDKSVNGNIVPLPKKAKKTRKKEFNRNKNGSVRRINDQVYVDFIYLSERVRESSGLKWTDENVKKVRKQLDKIMVEIESETFRFAEVFPKSKKAEYFRKQEKLVRKVKEKPDEVFFEPEARAWYMLHRAQDVRGRTMLGYKSLLDNYLIPILGGMTFAEFNTVIWRELVKQAREKELRGKPIGNKTINKLFVPLKMICHDVAAKYGWGETYNPFFDWKKLKETKREKVLPFSLSDQRKLHEAFPDHWSPYFDLAFCAGLRPGEQIAIEPDDIDWENRLLHIRQAVTMDEKGKRCLDDCKNEYSQRTIELTDIMFDALERQKEIHDRLGGRYFFCTEAGRVIYYSNLRTDVWIPALKKAGLTYRSMGQTRHTFATVALSFGENALWIANVMGHCDAEMVIKTYGKFVPNIRGSVDGVNLTEAYHKIYRGKNDGQA
jgi:integrase